MCCAGSASADGLSVKLWPPDCICTRIFLKVMMSGLETESQEACDLGWSNIRCGPDHAQTCSHTFMITVEQQSRT